MEKAAFILLGHNYAKLLMRASLCPALHHNEWLGVMCQARKEGTATEEKINCLSSFQDKERNGLRAVITPLLEGCAGDGGKEQCCKVGSVLWDCSREWHHSYCQGRSLCCPTTPFREMKARAAPKASFPSLRKRDSVSPFTTADNNLTPELHVWECKAKNKQKRRKY